MFIDVNRISQKGMVLDDSIELDESSLIEEYSYFLDSVNYRILFKRDGEQIKAKGRIKTMISLRCVGCLDDFDLRVDSQFDIILFPANLVAMSNAALSPDEMEYIFYEGDRIDLAKILMEQVNLFIPFNPFCNPNCKGMCPNCGANLNYDRCQCERPQNELNLFFGKA